LRDAEAGPDVIEVAELRDFFKSNREIAETVLNNVITKVELKEKHGKAGKTHHHLVKVLCLHPELAATLKANPTDFEPLRPFPRLHQFCLNHPEVLKEHLLQLDANPSSWVPMRFRILRFLKNHPEESKLLLQDSSQAAIDKVFNEKPGMLRYLTTHPGEVSELLSQSRDTEKDGSNSDEAQAKDSDAVTSKFGVDTVMDDAVIIAPMPV